MVELLSSSGDGFHWNVNFVRPVQDWEVELVVNFLDLIYSVLVRGNGMDQLCWKPSASGVFNYTDNLQKHIVVVLDLCCMCKKDGESIEHLFLHCHVA